MYRVTMGHDEPILCHCVDKEPQNRIKLMFHYLFPTPKKTGNRADCIHVSLSTADKITLFKPRDVLLDADVDNAFLYPLKAFQR